MNNSYYAAILTLLKKDCGIDEQAMREYIRFLLQKEVKGFFPCGTSGEYTNLTKKENLQLLNLVLEENNGRKPVIPCASTSSAFNTIELLRDMKTMGVTEVSICPPYYVPLRQEDIRDYYDCILQKTDMNLYLYNIPAFTNPILFETFQELIGETRIRGIKDSSGSMKIISRYIAKSWEVREDFRVMTGTDEMILPALSGGCYGSVSALSGIVPEAHNLLYASYGSNLPLAQRLQAKITALAGECEQFVFPVGYKLALEARGFEMPAFRQNVVEQGNEVAYQKARMRIHKLVAELLEYVEKNSKGAIA